VLWIPPLGWEVGYFAWGWICDRSRRTGESRVAALRRLLSVCLALNLAFAAVPFLSSLAAVMCLMFLAMFVSSGFVVLSVSYATEIFSSRHSGLIAGAGAGSWSCMVALMMPFFGRLFDQHRYQPAFLIVTAIPVLGYAGWMYLSGPMSSRFSWEQRAKPV